MMRSLLRISVAAVLLALLAFTLTVLCVAAGRTRYLLYSVNPGEGFNLRRDVHVRVASLVKKLREKEDWILVLPPWPHLYHWKSRFDQSNLPWGIFFDVSSLSEYVPSIDFVTFDKYLQREGYIDEVVHLQNFAEGWGDRWEEKMEDRPCIDPPSFHKVSPGVWRGHIPGGREVQARSFRCTSVQGFADILVPELQQRKPQLRSVMFARFEILMHPNFGGVERWAARKSMVYAAQLREIGNTFMRNELGYDPGSGNGRQRPRNGGGPFLAVHMRRRDYLHARPGMIPSLEGASHQINKLKSELGLDQVFLATDASKEEKQKLKLLADGVVWFEPTEDEIYSLRDGGVAIIDQWIASHGNYFIGTAESTFSFRIREDRQFMGFSQNSTFHNLCGPEVDETNPHSCDKPTYWKLVETEKRPHQEL